ncbi:hypothetical protein BOTCAL_0004g00570 [Botryotinia calthae]|uniref:Uncharacterized protein n=1 Tax=Botryotinia calthae TaxID=38488 RepID=A0A4Y8DK58_9HELO|nr:hypothetical protein BOTCAL_0004g00570 [Botryotinia calthae]
MKSLIELSNRESPPSSGQDATSFVHEEQQSQLPNPAGATGLENSGAIPHNPVRNKDQIDDMEFELPESNQNICSPTTQETTQMFAPTSSMAQSQILGHHTSHQTVQNFSPHVEHVECADLLGSKVGDPSIKRGFHLLEMLRIMINHIE